VAEKSMARPVPKSIRVDVSFGNNVLNGELVIVQWTAVTYNQKPEQSSAHNTKHGIMFVVVEREKTACACQSYFFQSKKRRGQQRRESSTPRSVYHNSIGGASRIKN
jgi:hypothetical protein